MRTIRTQEVEEMRAEDDVTVINVLDREHFEHVHIPGSRNIPISEDDFVDQVEQLVEDRGQAIVVHCSDPECEASTEAAEALEEAGYTNVLHYEGGIKAWLGSGREVVRHGELVATSAG